MKAFRKDIFRTVNSTLGRFVAILLIVGLGSGFYAALRMVCPDMKISADKYYDAQNMMDLRIVSTNGLTQDDLAELKKIDGVENAALAYETDIVGNLHDEQITTRVHSLTNDSNVNDVELVDGRMPTASNECVISSDCIIAADKNIGDVIHVDECISDLGNTLSVSDFTIVGKIESPLYIAFASPGTTSLGSGQLDEYIYVTQDAFASDYPYNEVFLTVSGAKDMYSYSSEYSDAVNSCMDKIKEIAPAREQARVDSLKASAQEKLDEKWKEYREKEASANSELNDAQTKLDESKAQLDSSRSTLDSTSSSLYSAQRQITAAKSSLDKAKSQRDEISSQLDEVNTQISALEKQLEVVPPSSEQYAPLNEQLISLKSTQSQLSGALDQANQGVSDGEKKLKEAQSKLNYGINSYYAGESQYQSGQEQYKEGQESLEANKTSVNDQLQDAKRQLEEAQADIDKIESSEWMVMDRSKNQSAESFKSDAERVDNIAKVFPLVFFLVAALVALTTMTRMIDEERLNIGTYKALGFSRRRVATKFFLYAFLSSGLGAFLGIVLLSETLPSFIIYAYSILYRMPHDLLMPIDIPLATLSFVVGVGLTILATLLATLGTLHEKPAELMRQKVSKKGGTRTLLEHITPIWKRMSFSSKVTIRNLLRYKKRSLMTIFGIAGCTALLLTGFGLSNSINDIIDKQFGNTVLYNTIVTEKDDITATQVSDLEAVMNDDQEVEVSVRAETQPIITASDNTSKEMNTTMIVPQDATKFNELWKLHERDKSEVLSIDDSGVLVNEKLLSALSLNVGDEITLLTTDDMGNSTNHSIKAKISGYFENYVSNYVICTPKFYSELNFNQEPKYKSYFAKLADGDEGRDSFANKAKETGGVKTISYNDEVIETYRNALRSVDMVVVILVVCAALLAFVVLFNLNNINICERKREIATLKVLGFNRHEIVMYIYRETIILTILGCIVGLLFGIWLETFVVVSAEVDYVMFGRQIHAMSYVIAALITIVFSAIVMLFMRRKFSAVDMVESLKSNE